MLDGRQIRLDASKPRDRPEGGNRNFGGNSGGYGGNSGGGFRNNSRNPGNSQVNLSQEDKNLKSGAMGTFTGKKVLL